MYQRYLYNWENITGGVPQGSVFEPLLFLMYSVNCQKVSKSYLNTSVDEAKLRDEEKLHNFIKNKLNTKEQLLRIRVYNGEILEKG